MRIESFCFCNSLAVLYNVGYTYDDNGSMLTRTDSLDSSENMTFDYNALSRMIRAKKNGTVAGLFDYNADGMRVRHYSSERGDVDYFYDDRAVIEERRADGTLLAHYRYADRLLRLDTETDSQYYHHDALGSTVNLTDSAGNTEVSYRLDPWGRIRSQTGTTVNRHVFTGQEHDENTGLINFGVRYYGPATARFTTQDSYLGEQNIPPSLHRYVYAYSNPTVYIDLYGYQSQNISEDNEDAGFTRWLGEMWDASVNWMFTDKLVTVEDKSGREDFETDADPSQRDELAEEVEKIINMRKGGYLPANNTEGLSGIEKRGKELAKDAIGEDVRRLDKVKDNPSKLVGVGAGIVASELLEKNPGANVALKGYKKHKSKLREMLRKFKERIKEWKRKRGKSSSNASKRPTAPIQTKKFTDNI